MLLKNSGQWYTKAVKSSREVKNMMYPFLQLNDNTEIVHSDMNDDGTVKVYIEKPVEGGFHSASCFLPKYEWKGINGFTENDIEKYQKLLESVAHLIIRFSQQGGFDNASNL